MSSIAFSVLIIGLDNSGKTSIIYNVKSNVNFIKIDIFI